LRSLEKSRCFFGDLLGKFSKADSNTVASAVARLYEEGKISQDKDGRFELKSEAQTNESLDQPATAARSAAIDGPCQSGG